MDLILRALIMALPRDLPGKFTPAIAVTSRKDCPLLKIREQSPSLVKPCHKNLRGKKAGKSAGSLNILSSRYPFEQGILPSMIEPKDLLQSGPSILPIDFVRTSWSEVLVSPSYPEDLILKYNIVSWGP